MSEKKTVDDMMLSINGSEFSIEDVSFTTDGANEVPHKEYMVGPYEFEMSVKTELSFEDEDEYAQYLIDMGYTVVREMDGEIIAVADGIEVKNGE